MINYRTLQQRAVDFRTERGWKDFHLPKNMVISLIAEFGELAQHFQYADDEEILEQLKTKREAVADELVDVLWWTLLLFNDFEIDIAEAFVAKMQKNCLAHPDKNFPAIDLVIETTTDDLLEMTDLINQFRQLRGWGDNVHPRDLVLKMSEEIGELARLMIWVDVSEFPQYVHKHYEEFRDELVDVLICILLLFHHLGFDIALEFDRKMAKNAIKYPPTRQ